MQNTIRPDKKPKQERNGQRPEKGYGARIKNLAQELKESKAILKILFLVVLFCFRAQEKAGKTGKESFLTAREGYGPSTCLTLLWLGESTRPLDWRWRQSLGATFNRYLWIDDWPSFEQGVHDERYIFTKAILEVFGRTRIGPFVNWKKIKYLL